MKLMKLNKKNIIQILKEFEENNGIEMTDSLFKLFSNMNDNYYDTMVKCSSLNHMYSTSIKYLDPIVENITLLLSKTDIDEFSLKDFENMVDEISYVEWNSRNSGKLNKRNNLSFSSKYIHFLSNGKVMIYDSYIWVLLTAYLNQYKNKNYKYTNPSNYKEFLNRFKEFKYEFNLNSYTNYQLDKYLWFYGKKMTEVYLKENNNLSQSKRKLLKLLKEN